MQGVDIQETQKHAKVAESLLLLITIFSIIIDHSSFKIPLEITSRIIMHTKKSTHYSFEYLCQKELIIYENNGDYSSIKINKENPLIFSLHSLLDFNGSYKMSNFELIEDLKRLISNLGNELLETSKERESQKLLNKNIEAAYTTINDKHLDKLCSSFNPTLTYANSNKPIEKLVFDTIHSFRLQFTDDNSFYYGSNPFENLQKTPLTKDELEFIEKNLANRNKEDTSSRSDKI
ncbi:MAG: hypothetical protein ACTSSK_13155 [Candidatus Heimdallarchaeota archaeon]